MEIYSAFDGLNATLIRMAHRFHGAQLLQQLRSKTRKTKEKVPQLGSLIHERWMEAESYAARYCILPGRYEACDPISRRKRAAFQSTAKATGRELIAESLHLKVMEGLTALEANHEACELRTQARLEVSMFWRDHLWGEAKGRPDLLGDGWLVDLKCYHQGRFEENFVKSFRQQALGIQLIWYKRGLLAVGEPVERLGHLILDTETSQIRLRWMSRKEIQESENFLDQALAKLRILRNANTWP